MKKPLLIILLLMTGATALSARKLTDYVNPFLGTTTLWEPEDLGYVRHRETRTWGAVTFPIPEGLESVEVTHGTPYGEIKVVRNGRKLHFELPVGVTATFKGEEYKCGVYDVLL